MQESEKKMSSNYYEIIKSVPLTEELTMFIAKREESYHFKRRKKCPYFYDERCTKYFAQIVNENDICIEETE